MLKTPSSVRKLALITAGVSLLCIGVKRTEYTTRTQLVDTLTCEQKKGYIHEDKETTDILDIMSGMMDRESFSEFLRNHGYWDRQIDESFLWEKDEALYHTLWEMHRKYGNPRIAFSGDFKNYEHMLYNFFHPFALYKKRVHEYGRPRFNFITNKIAIYDLGFHKLIFDKPSVEKNQKNEIYGQENGEFPVPDMYTDAQRLLINYWISELAHAEQAQQQKRMRITNLIVRAIDYGRSGLNYDKTYHMPGTLEYEAHTVIEPKLIEEFISTYANYCETMGNDQHWNLAKFHNGYFFEYKNKVLASEELYASAHLGNTDAAYIKGCEAEQKFKKFREQCLDQNDILCYLKEAIARFDLSARNCSPDNEAVYKIIKITNEFSIELDQGIYWTKILISTVEEDEECDRQKLSILRNTLAQLYAKNENHTESQIARERARAEG